MSSFFKKKTEILFNLCKSPVTQKVIIRLTQTGYCILVGKYLTNPSTDYFYLMTLNTCVTSKKDFRKSFIGVLKLIQPRNLCLKFKYVQCTSSLNFFLKNGVVILVNLREFVGTGKRAR